MTFYNSGFLWLKNKRIDMVSNGDFQKDVELINKFSNVLLTTHIRPDGDACTGQLQYHVIY